jgi:hypothetical protein
MKRYLVAILILFPANRPQLAVAFFALTVLFDAGTPELKASVKMAKDGCPLVAIVTAPEGVATPAEEFAAGELALFLKQITGAEFPIVGEGANAGPAIHVGWTERAKAAGIDLDQLGEEEWVLQTDGRDLILVGGRPRGTLYAVYEFLESHAGCRWVSFNTSVIPSNPNLSVRELKVQGRPAFSWRETTLYQRHDNPEYQSKEDFALFLVRNRYNGAPFWLDEPRFGFAVRFGRPGTSHTFYAYQKEWDDLKPEYFAMDKEGNRMPLPDGALGADFCLTNPEVRDRIYQQLLEFIRKDREECAETGLPAPRLYALSQNDTSSKYCRCPDCMTIAEREGSYSGTTLDFVNSIAARVGEVHPEVLLLTEAYQFTKRPPKTIRPLSNVVVRIALLDYEYRADEFADVLRPLTAPTNGAARAIQEGWAAILPGNQLFIWDYAQFRALFRHPYDATPKILKNFDFWNGLGIERVFIEQSGMDLSFRPMREWMFFRKSVHPEVSNDLLVDEFLGAYFGPAVAPMRSYYHELASLTEAGDRPYFETPAAVNPYLTAEFFSKANGWLDEAEALAQGTENEKFLRHVRFERVPVDSGMLHLWHRYSESRQWKGRKEEVLRRYESNKRMLIDIYATSVDWWVNSGRGSFDGELAVLRMEPPEQFAGRNANLRLIGQNAPGPNRVEDGAAANGFARSLGGGRPEDHKLPFHLKLHDNASNLSWDPMVLDGVPQDEAYHWHLVDTVPLSGNSGLWSNVPTWIPLGWGAVPPPSNEMEVWVSMKFTGPTYVEGSTQPDQVLIDRIVIVPPEEQ